MVALLSFWTGKIQQNIDPTNIKPVHDTFSSDRAQVIVHQDVQRQIYERDDQIRQLSIQLNE